ncbi:hypothetical protein ANN_06146 [Periplaneta americana]|uniref:Uncharacterized protein n=1 Tax=Periplaneta americana TaxID=6978 RepID=A0ABQ8TCT9_PERAM|nr:hypothetical protein ANN_06146 [Periplaneta americana]
MAGLCESGNEPLSSLKAICKSPSPGAYQTTSMRTWLYKGLRQDQHRLIRKALGLSVPDAYETICPRSGTWLYQWLRQDGPPISIGFMNAIRSTCDNAGEMSPGSNTESYPAFAHIGLRENPGKNLNQVTCPDRESNPGHLVSRPDALTVTPQRNLVAKVSYNGWGDHRANHTIPAFWLDDRPPLLRHVDARPAAGWSVWALHGL